MNKQIPNDQDRIDFVNFMMSKLSNTKATNRVAKCALNINELPKKGKNTFEFIRKYHNPKATTEFLSLFENPSGLKFLTHDLDPDSGLTMADIIKNSKEILSHYKGKIPMSLFLLMNGFISGEKWMDFTGKNYDVFLECKEMQKWMEQNPGLHPIVSDEFGDIIQRFRNTVRISKPRLTEAIKYLAARYKSISALEIHQEGLDKADFYTNVYFFIERITKKILEDIAQRDNNAKVDISYKRTTLANFRQCTVRITHLGSEANPFEEVKGKLSKEGGALFSLMKRCKGYCDWSIEGNFEGEFKRWRILDSSGLPEIEDLAPEDVKGFTHVLTFYKK